MSHEISSDLNTTTGERVYRATYQEGKSVWHASFTNPKFCDLSALTGQQYVDHLLDLKIIAQKIEQEQMVTAKSGIALRLAKYCNVATYANGDVEDVGVVGGQYVTTDQAVFRDCLIAITDDIGLSPSGAFSVYDGQGVCVVWSLGVHNGKNKWFMLLDNFAGVRALTAGYVITDPVCDNTIKVALYESGDTCAKLRHSGDLNGKLAALPVLVGRAKEDAASLCDAYDDYANHTLSDEQIDQFIESLPGCNKMNKSGKLTAQSANKRQNVRTAAKFEVNAVGDEHNLARWVNAANYSVDRDPTTQEVRGSSKGRQNESMLFGTQGSNVNEILRQADQLVEIIVQMSDGTEQAMTVPEAIATGQVDPSALGASLLSDMLSDN
jgi:hypothetical protein